MEILFVCATPLESVLLREKADLHGPLQMGSVQLFGDGRFGLLHTYIGMVNTAIHLTKAIMTYRPQKVVNFGIAGAFEGKCEMLEVVQVVQDTYAELGAERAEGFLGLEQMGFPLFETQQNYYYNQLKNPQPEYSNLRSVSGITVNTVHGILGSIDQVTHRWDPDVESMEGAAVFHTCLTFDLPFGCYRAISNKVEVRNRANWRVKEAVVAVQQHVFEAYLSGRL